MLVSRSAKAASDLVVDAEARRFLNAWLTEHRTALRSPTRIDALATELFADASQSGASIRAVLAAVGNDPFVFLRRAARRQRTAHATLRFLQRLLPAMKSPPRPRSRSA